MRRLLVGGVGLVWALSGARAQTAGDVQKSLEGTLKGKPMLIRDFLADTQIHYEWQGGQLQHDPEKLFTLGVFTADSVKVHASHGTVDGVLIKGTRRTLLKQDLTAADALSVYSDKVLFDVDLRGADKAAVGQLAALLFFPDVDSAVRAVPPQFMQFLRFRRTSGKWVSVAGKWQRADGPVSNPRVVSTAEPQFSEEARREKVSGNVLIAIAMTAEGGVEAEWLVRPLGYGLDEKAFETVSKYRFGPVTMGGQTVGSMMAIEVNFQIF